MRDQAARDNHFAGSYDRALAGAEKAFMGAARAALVGGLRGRVLEIGAGTGANLPHYAPGVELTLVEPNPEMRTRLRDRIAADPSHGGPPIVLAAPAERLPLPDASFDHVVTTLVLCSVTDVSEALTQIVRVVRPGGTLAFLEHSRASRLRGVVQRAVSPLTQRYAGGCRCDRDTVAAIASAGLRIVQVAPLRTPWPYGLLPENPFLVGYASRPS